MARENHSGSTPTLWTGRVASAIPVPFLVLDGVGELFKPAPLLEAFARLEIPEGRAVGLGVVLLTCTIIYLIPQTSVLGAILLTGFLGGAVAIHVRGSHPVLFPRLFPVIVGARVWGVSYLRDHRSVP